MQVGAWYRVGMSVLLLLARCVNAQPVSRVHRKLCLMCLTSGHWPVWAVCITLSLRQPVRWCCGWVLEVWQ